MPPFASIVSTQVFPKPQIYIYTGVARLDGLFSSQLSNVGIRKLAFEASGQQWW